MTDETEVQNAEDLPEVEIETPEGELPEGEQEHETEEQKQSRSQSSKQRLKRKLREEEARNRKMYEDQQALVKKLEELETKLKPIIEPPKPRPNRFEFGTEEAYEDALFEWRDNQKGQKADFKPEVKNLTQDNEAVKKPAKELVEKWTKQVESAIDKYDDFEEVAYKAPISDLTAELVAENDQGAEIAYFLGKNPEEAKKLSNMSLANQVRELDRLAVKLKPKLTNTPNPIEPVRGEDTGTVDVSKMTPEQYRAYRNKQRAGRT